MKESTKIEARLNAICRQVRIDIIEAAYRAGNHNAHCGGSLSAVEILVTLYHQFVRRDSSNSENRDRMIISKAHASLAQYCVLKSCGVLNHADLETFEQNGSDYTVHAHRDLEKGFEFSGGSLGLGLSFAVGVAKALKDKQSDRRVYVLLGDGECNEGIVWEAMMFASHYKLNNLTVIVDHNHLQADGFVEDVLDSSSLADKFRAFGCDTIEVDGHDVVALLNAFSLPSTEKPTAIIAETVKGKGVSFMENKYNWHYTVLSENKYKKAMSELTKDE